MTLPGAAGSAVGEGGLSSALGLLVVCLGKINEQQSQSTCWYSGNIDNIHQVSV